MAQRKAPTPNTDQAYIKWKFILMFVIYKLQLDHTMIEVRRYQRVDGVAPITDWLAGLRDVRARARLEIRFRRLSLGIFGDIKPVGAGVLELREDIGPGYRTYIGRHGSTLIILLCGGDKRSQDVDIQRAKDYWLDWKRRNS